MLKNFKHLEVQVRRVSTHLKLNQKNHYDSLGVTAKATQADIKSAYYKMSMLYHPDKNKNNEDAGSKFRDISEAYEVLGNVKTRKLYDKGLYIHNSPSFDIPLNKFYKSRETKSRPPTPYGRTTVYDFDEWSRSHYGATFEKDMRYKKQQRIKKQREQQIEQDIKTEKVVYLIGILVVLTGLLFYEKDLNNADQLTRFAGHVVVTPKSDR